MPMLMMFVLTYASHRRVYTRAHRCAHSHRHHLCRHLFSCSSFVFAFARRAVMMFFDDLKPQTLTHQHRHHDDDVDAHDGDAHDGDAHTAAYEPHARHHARERRQGRVRARARGGSRSD